MPGKCTKKHTPIVSKAQQGLMGADLARRRAGKKPRLSEMSTEELAAHLRESRGKNLPARTTPKLTPKQKQVRKRIHKAVGKK